MKRAIRSVEAAERAARAGGAGAGAGARGPVSQASFSAQQKAASPAAAKKGITKEQLAEAKHYAVEHIPKVAVAPGKLSIDELQVLAREHKLDPPARAEGQADADYETALIKFLHDNGIKEKSAREVITLPKDKEGKAIPSKQSEAFNAAWNDEGRDVDAVNALVSEVRAKKENRDARRKKAENDKAARSKLKYKLKKGAFKGGGRAVGGISGAAAGGAVGHIPGAVIGGALGGGLGGVAAGAAWNAAEAGTDLVAEGRERELATPAGRWNRNGRASLTSKPVLKETGKDAAVGVVTGALAPLTGLAGEAAGAAAVGATDAAAVAATSGAGEAAGGAAGSSIAETAASAATSSALNATAKEGTDLVMDKSLGLDGPGLWKRAGNLVTGAIIGGVTGGFDGADGVTETTGVPAAQEALTDNAYGEAGEVASSLVELTRKSPEESPKATGFGDLAEGQVSQIRQRKREERAQEREKELRKRAEEARSAVATRAANTKEHDEVLPPGRHKQGY